jgi:DNA-binding transcriptional ArsR family regulator
MERLPIAESTLLVDANHYTIQRLKSQEKLISRELSKALALLAQKGVVNFSEYIKEVFQFNFYDPECHKQKIHNSVQKLKKLLPPDLKIITRYEKIYLEGETSQIFVIPLNAINVDEEIEVLRPSNIPPKIIRALSTMRIPNKATLQRKDFEEELQISKSAALRLLISLEKHGLVTKTGQGKSTLYMIMKLSENLV